MIQPVISVKNVSKSFIFWEDRPTSIKKVLIDLTKGMFKAGYKRKVEVLHDISFDINPGDFVGIMGHNGAGKSTILKIISGIYSTTSGTVTINGRIAPLLELGAGFTDQLSGFDNIFLNAAILGFSREKTLKAMDSIIEFSELGDRIHTPVRNYSSGMTVRLAFAIAVHLEAPILLFDEVLAVGDVAFQEKCIKKIHELHSKGSSIILVTHSPELVQKFCNRCIVISNKQKIFDGSAIEGGNIYSQTLKPLNS